MNTKALRPVIRSMKQRHKIAFYRSYYWAEMPKAKERAEIFAKATREVSKKFPVFGQFLSMAPMPLFDEFYELEEENKLLSFMLKKWHNVLSKKYPN